MLAIDFFDCFVRPSETIDKRIYNSLRELLSSLSKMQKLSIENIIRPKFKLIFLFLFASLLASSQNKFRLPIWTFHDNNTTIAGLSFGLTSTEKRVNVKSIGLHFELLGLGIIVPMMPSSPLKDSFKYEELSKELISEKIYGLNISPFGTASNTIEISGISINGIASISRKTNGLSFSLLGNCADITNGGQFGLIGNEVQIINGLQIAISNHARIKSNGLQLGGINYSQKHIGIQIGIYNKAKTLRGIQIGLWNVNSRQKFPIINW